MSIRLVGRKQYHAWSDNLTVGLGVLTNKWSGFVPNPDHGAYAELFDICDVLGELVPRSIGIPKRVFYGRDVNSLIMENETWTPAKEQRFSPGCIGRRLLMSWSDELMMSIDKIGGAPSRFDIAPKKGKSAMLYNLEEIFGELVEVQHGRPQGNVFGRDANYLVVSSGSWAVEGECIEGALIDHLNDSPTSQEKVVITSLK